MGKKIILSVIIFSLFFITCKSEKPDSSGAKAASVSAVTPLTNEGFKKMVYNYEVNKEWKFEGNKPVIIDFYADWCAPCRQLSPIVEEIAKEYSGKIIVYKVDTEKEKALTQSVGITGLPTLLFIPAKGKPQVSMGFVSKESLVKAVNDILLVK